MLNQQGLYNLNNRLFDIGGSFKKVVNFICHHERISCLRRNTDLVKNENTDKKIYLCALGPSLKQVDLNRIEGDTIVVNRFYKFGADFPEFVPTYYVMIDYGFAEERYKKDFCDALDSYLPKGTIFLLNSKLYGSGLLEKYDRSNIYYLSCYGGHMHGEKNYKIDGVFPAFQNVTGAAILSSMLMGYKEVVLLGCDFNAFASPVQNHCYKDKSEQRLWKMSWELYTSSFMAKNHDDLQKYADRNGINVFNSTRGSLIDAYPFRIEEDLYVK